MVNNLLQSQKLWDNSIKHYLLRQFFYISIVTVVATFRLQKIHKISKLSWLKERCKIFLLLSKNLLLNLMWKSICSFLCKNLLNLVWEPSGIPYETKRFWISCENFFLNPLWESFFESLLRIFLWIQCENLNYLSTNYFCIVYFEFFISFCWSLGRVYAFKYKVTLTF